MVKVQKIYIKKVLKLYIKVQQYKKMIFIQKPIKEFNRSTIIIIVKFSYRCNNVASYVKN